MRAFFRVGHGEGKLPGPVAGPARLHPQGGFQHVQRRVGLQRFDDTVRGALRTDPAQQYPHRRYRAARQQHSQSPAHGLGPVGELHQHQGVEGQHQVDRCHPVVRLGEQPVGKALNQSQHQ